MRPTIVTLIADLVRGCYRTTAIIVVLLASQFTDHAAAQNGPEAQIRKLTSGSLIILAGREDPSVQIGLERTTLDLTKATVCYYGVNPLAAHEIMAKAYTSWFKVVRFKKPQVAMWGEVDDFFGNLRSAGCLTVVERDWVLGRLSQGRRDSWEQNSRILSNSIMFSVNASPAEYQVITSRIEAERRALLDRMADNNSGLSVVIVTKPLNSDMLSRICTLGDDNLTPKLSWLKAKVLPSIDLVDGSDYRLTKPTLVEETPFPIVLGFLTSPTVINSPDIDSVYRSITSAHRRAEKGDCATAIVPFRFYRTLTEGLKRADIKFWAPIRQPFVFANADALTLANEETAARRVREAQAAEEQAKRDKARAEAEARRLAEERASRTADANQTCNKESIVRDSCLLFVASVAEKASGQASTFEAKSQAIISRCNFQTAFPLFGGGAEAGKQAVTHFNSGKLKTATEVIEFCSGMASRAVREFDRLSGAGAATPSPASTSPDQQTLRAVGFEHRGNLNLRGASECIQALEQRFTRRIVDRYDESRGAWKVPQVVVQYELTSDRYGNDPYRGRRFIMMSVSVADFNRYGISNSVDLGEMHCVFSSGNNVMSIERPRS